MMDVDVTFTGLVDVEWVCGHVVELSDDGC